MVEGERDPRCLLLTFALFSQVMHNFPIGHFDEDAFDVMSCYFPITYTQPSNDPYNITRLELAMALEEALTSARDFAPYAIPLFLEKMASDLNNSKIDAFRALARGARVYGAEKIVPYLTAFWTCVRLETLKPLRGIDEEILSTALPALKEVVLALKESEKFSDEEFIEFINLVVKDLEPAFAKTELGLRKAAVQILVHICCDRTSYSMVTSKIFPFLLEKFASEVENKSELLTALNEFIGLCEIDWQPLTDQQSILNHCRLLLASSDLETRRNAIRTLTTLLKKSGVALTDEEKSDVRGKLFESLRFEKFDEICASAFEVLISSGNLKIAEELLLTLSGKL